MYCASVLPCVVIHDCHKNFLLPVLSSTLYFSSSLPALSSSIPTSSSPLLLIALT